jgi:hypothetical protein
MDAIRSAPRILEQGCSGPDVALLQRDLNVWYRLWGAPAPVLLHEDGVLGELTELAFRRASRRLGLLRVVVEDTAQITPRDRLIVRHLGRLLLARSDGGTYAVPASVHRTPEEIERGKEERDYERRLKARFAAERAALEIAQPQPEITANVRNQSSRRGLKPRIIVLHTTEGHNRPGLTDLQGLVRFFDSPASQASSHVANDAEGNDARMVPDEAKAWTQAAFNAVALSIEQIGFASQTTWPDAQLRNTASWVAHWSKRWDIPLVRSTARGVCQHVDLGAAGGGHHDCGGAYPFDRVIALARELRGDE